ncbi:MAG: AP2 domain-containing protein [Candidatus Moranbacteria bacterium]|nr:AP2 domain-containing protein [Candidatus Moranbacteria bacterium]
MKKIEVKIGDKYGRLTILEEASRSNGKPGRRHRRFLCECECGEKIITELASLRNGSTKSCGCFKRDLTIQRNKKGTHCMSRSRTYTSWYSMKTRCFNKNHEAYSRYNGKLNDRWLKFENFYEDMGERPRGMSLDRIDNSKGYSKENCRWATAKEQNNNKKNNKKLIYNGIIYNMSQLIQKIKMNRSTFEARIRRGWTVSDAVEKEIGNNFNRA